MSKTFKMAVGIGRSGVHSLPRVPSLAVIAVFSGLSAVSTAPATADVVWRNGQPIFNSDRRRPQRYWDNNYYQDEERFNEPPARSYRQYPTELSGGPRPSIAPEAPQIVSLNKSEPAGKIIIDTAGRRLYYALGGNRAYQYPISVGRDGFRWTGNHKVTRVQAWPSWHPPAEMRRRQPGLPIKMEGGLRNPLGAKALYLGSTLYRIHGTNDVKTIGRAASSGCFRMMNKHVLHLANLAPIGTDVSVVKRYDGAPAPTISRLDGGSRQR